MRVYKDRQYLIFDYEDGRTVKYDFATKTAIGIKGKPVKNLCSQLSGLTLNKLFDCCEDAVTSNIPMPEVQPPKNVIPSASEANKMTNNAIDSCTTQQLAELSKLIRDAIADGKFSISEDGCLKPETRKKLEELGYKVETGTQYNESYYSISWKE